MEKFAIEDYKLCYVDRNLAYFTTQALSEQTGDDFDDAPYEHNAGEPYTYRPDWDGKHGHKEWDILMIAFRSGMETPAQVANGNSRYSVDDINSGQVAWLRPDPWSVKEGKQAIVAGVNPLEFIRIMNENDGEIYLPAKRLALFK